MLLLQAASTTDAVSNLNNWISGINFKEPTWDLFIIVFFLMAAFVYGLTLGRERIIVILVAIYMALAIINAAPFLDSLTPSDSGPNNIFAFKISVFLGIFVILFFLLSRNTLLRALTKSEAPGNWWQVIIFSMVHVGLLISITLSFIPSEFYDQLSPITRSWFVGVEARFFWIIAPIVVMALSKGVKSDED